MQNKIISIVVPVYNVEKYINNCIECILSQSYSNWELILVDDGSSDKSGAICDEYATRDSRIIVIHKQNAGVAEARNTALEHVSGEFVTFLDSDDEIPSNTLQLYIENFAKSSDIDMVIGGFTRIYTDTSKKEIHSCRQPSIEYDKSLILRKIDDSCCWNECIRLSLIGDKRFKKEISWNEDHLFNYECIAASCAVCFITNNVYNYYIRNRESLSNVKDPFVVINTCAKICEYRLDMLRNCKDQMLRDSVINKYIDMFHLSVKLLATRNYYSQIDEFRENIPLKCLLDKDLSARIFCNTKMRSSIAFPSYIILRNILLLKKILGL